MQGSHSKILSILGPLNDISPSTSTLSCLHMPLPLSYACRFFLSSPLCPFFFSSVIFFQTSSSLNTLLLLNVLFYLLTFEHVGALGVKRYPVYRQIPCWMLKIGSAHIWPFMVGYLSQEKKKGYRDIILLKLDSVGMFLRKWPLQCCFCASVWKGYKVSLHMLVSVTK